MTEAKVLDDIDKFLEEQRRKLSEDKKVLNDILNFLEEKQQALVLNDGNHSQDSHVDEVDGKSSTCVENYDLNLLDFYEDDHPRVMVRYGEFSPLNPAFRSRSKPLLGLGEYEERRKILLEKKKREYQQYLSKAKNEKEREKNKSKLPENNNNENHPRLTNVSEVDGLKVSPRTSNMPREVLSPGRGVVEATDRCYARWQQQVYRRELDRQIIDKKKRMKEEKERERRECEKKQKEMMMEQIKLSKSIAEQIRRYQMTELLEDDAIINGKENQPVNDENEIFIEGVDLPDASSPVCSLGFNPVTNKLLESPPHRVTSSIFNTTSPSKSPEQVSYRINSSIFNMASNKVRTPTPFPISSNVSSRGDPSLQSPLKNSIAESVTSTDFECSPQRKPLPDDSDSRPERLLHQKSQQEIYKNELARQIEEKKRLEMERKRKEAEEEKKIDEKVRLDEEKLRQEYEKEQAERAYRATQRVQQEVRLQEHLTKVQKEAEERKRNTRQVGNVIATSKPSVYPTNHGVIHNKGAMKNVSFAPKACVYSFQNTNNYVQSNNVSSTENRTQDPSQIIVEAPYILAVKGNEVGYNNFSTNFSNEYRPPSPPVPAIKTQNMLKSLPKTDNIEIPSTVSMSPEAREKFLKDAKILSNLSEIRRRLLIKHAGLEAK